jgi:group I intron endonuclease
MKIEKKFNFVYLTICKINGNCYIGSHCTDKENMDPWYFGGGDLFKLAFKKYGKPSFHRIILKQCLNILEARNLESYYIEKFDTLRPNGYNISPSGGMDRGIFGIHSEESKLQMSRSRLGKEPWNKGKTGIYSKETIEQMIKNHPDQSGKNNPNYKNRGEKSPLYGIEFSENHKKNLAKSKMGEKNPNAGKYKIITPTGEKFISLSATDFIKEHPEYGINRHFLYSASKTKKTSHKGWKIIKIK